MCCPSTGTCVRCGSQFKRVGRVSVQSRFCLACGDEREREAAEKKQLKYHQGNCMECGKSFIGIWSKIYCSSKCANAERSRQSVGELQDRIGCLRKYHEKRAPGEMPTAERLGAMLDAAIASGCCPYCGKTTEESDWSLDHIVPVSSGGSNSMSNLKFVCSLCNSRKGGRSFDEFVMLSLPHTLPWLSDAVDDDGPYASAEEDAENGDIPGRGAKSAQGELVEG